ncbi:MAG TPA: hypothetical protein VK277_14330 [Acidimicrobiales bacterium]|nr:hypothetical protein [Acidimicrobiales bacterium]
MPEGTTSASARGGRRTSNGRARLTTVNGDRRGFVVPIVHVSLPESAVTAGFWAALGTAAVVGIVDLPLAALIGAGVVVARHRNAH